MEEQKTIKRIAHGELVTGVEDMQYHLTRWVDGQQWERDQAAVVQDVRRQAEHDLAAQNPGSTVTIDAVDHTLRRPDAAPPSDADTTRQLVEFVVEYTVSGQQNAFDA
jgi:hypothetical protein